MKKISILFLILMFSGSIFSNENVVDLKEQSNHSPLSGKKLSIESPSQATPSINSDSEINVGKTSLDKKGIKHYFKRNKTDFGFKFKNPSEEGRFSGLAIAGFIIGLVGLIIFGIPFGIAAFTMGLISFIMIMNSLGQLKGKGFAIAAFILGIVDIIGAIIFISMTL